MARLKIVKRPPRKPAGAQTAIIQESIKDALQPVAKQHVLQRERVVSGWQERHRPDFDSQVGVGPKQIFIRILITNGRKSLGKYGGTVKDLWDWINEGTPPHDIYPRFKPILKFKIDGEWFSSYHVEHPGTTGQFHDRKINQRLNKQFGRLIRAGLRRGLKRARS